MNVEFCVTSETAKTRAIDALRVAGFRVASGLIRLAYPFTILVEDLAPEDVDAVAGFVRAVDPCAGTIESARAVTAG